MIATRRVLICGHVGSGRGLAISTTSSSDITPTSTVMASASDCSVDIVPESYTITNNYCEPHIYIDYERFSRIAEIERLKAGWLKPHRQLKPFNSHSKITYNLPRSRIREKKQIFKQAA